MYSLHAERSCVLPKTVTFVELKLETPTVQQFSRDI